MTPTFRDVNKKFSTRYYLNLVLIDEENRRYFKQQVSFPSHIAEGCFAEVSVGNHYFQDTGCKFLSIFSIFLSNSFNQN